MNSHPERDWRRLARFLAGECSPDQDRKVRSWIVEDEERARLMDDLKRIWEASGTSVQSRDVEAAWEEVRGQLGADGPGGGTEPNAATGSSPGTTNALTSSPPPSSRPRSRSSSSRRRPLGNRAVAVGGMLLVAVLAVAVVFYQNEAPSPAEGTPRIFSTEAGQRTTVRLGDGSKVRLNVDSRLEVQPGFGTTNRRVYLNGEAYFEVTDDSARPFVVQVDGARTEVLGTAFGVRAYPDKSSPKVAVSEGEVAVHSDQSASRDTVRLEGNTLGVISGGHIEVVRRNAEIQKEIAWTDGRLVFDDAPFDRVVQRLQRWYGRSVTTRVDPATVDRLNAAFKDESFHQAIRAISVALDLQYRKEGTAVVFYRQDPDESE